MGHGEDRVGPVLVGRALVAVGDAAEGGHARADLGDLVVGHAPDAHAVGAEARAAVEEDRGDAAQDPAVLHPEQVLDERVLRHAELGRRGRVGLGDDGQVALRSADDRAVELVEGDLLDRRRHDLLGGHGERVGAALHLEVHANLEQLERGQLAHGIGAGLALQDLERPVEAELGVLLDRDREPHVEVVVAQVVVRDAGVRVDDLGRPPRVLRVDARGDEHRLVAQGARVEDRRHLADDPGVEQLLDAAQDIGLRDGELAGDGCVRARLDREAALHQVEQALVVLVEGHGGAALAAPDLQVSHWAASFAK